VVREHPDGLELLVVQEMGLVDDQDRCPASFGGLAGQDIPGLDGEGGGAVDGAAAEGGDDAGEDAAGAGGRVADVDDGVAGGVESGDGGPGSRRFCRCRPRR
jgi:hypothetical protein